MIQATTFEGFALATYDCRRSGIEAYLDGQLASFSALTVLVGSSNL